jgi:hypothetical protein
MQTEAPGAAEEAGRHPLAVTLLWAAAGYGFAALAWVLIAAAMVAADSADGAADAVVWFGTALGVIGIVAAGAAVLFVPVLGVETLLWRLVTLRFPRFEADRLGVAQGAALVALPWMLFNPLETRWAALISFGAAFFGLFAARMFVARLRPGALLGTDEAAE